MRRITFCLKQYVWIALITIVVSGCYYTTPPPPGYEVPICPVQMSINEALEETESLEGKPLFINNQPLPEDWWCLFGDSQLADLIEQTLQNNPTLHAAYAKIELAQEAANKVRSALFPTVNFATDIQKITVSKTGAIPPIPPVFPFNYTQYEGQFNFTYDLDIWLKNRNTFAAALGEVQAAIADNVFSQLALSMSVARVYFELQINYQRRDLAQALVDSFDRANQLIQQRVHQNLGTGIDYLFSQDRLAAARRTLSLIEEAILLTQNQLRAFIAGNFDETFCNLSVISKPLPSIPLPECLPLNLISYRPDIVSQLWLIQTAGRKVDVAIAGFYPDLNLSGFGGYQTIVLNKFFMGKSGYSDLELALSLPIFNAGLLQANLAATEIQYDLAVYKYNDLVINAVKEVLDGLIKVRKANERLGISRQETQYEEDIYQLTKLKFENNISSELDYLVQEQQVISALDNQAIATGETIQAMLLLIRALGGGYDASLIGECIVNKDENQ